MKSKKEKRQLLFKRGRAFFRDLEIYDGDEYHKDIGILWAGRKVLTRINQNSQQEFANHLEQINLAVGILLVEDKNKSYKDGYGPVGIVEVRYDGWRAEPHIDFFPWATDRNMLNAIVSGLHMAWNKKSIGVCWVKSLDNTKNMFDKVREYIPLYYLGKVFNGDPRGDEHNYYIQGKRGKR